jgi:hypothetical protein
LRLQRAFCAQADLSRASQVVIVDSGELPTKNADADAL